MEAIGEPHVLHRDQAAMLELTFDRKTVWLGQSQVSKAMELPLVEPAAVLAAIRIAIATKSVHHIHQPVPGALVAAPRDEVPLLGLRV